MLGMTFQNDNSLEWHLKANIPYKALDSVLDIWHFTRNILDKRQLGKCHISSSRWIAMSKKSVLAYDLHVNKTPRAI